MKNDPLIKSARLASLNIVKYVQICLWVSFIATVVGSNWVLGTFGIVPIGFGLTAPAGVYFAGLAFTLRDLLHERGGRFWILSAIIAGAMLSGLLEDAQRFALASGVAFLLSELADWTIYTPLRRKGWTIAVTSSNVVGLIVDSSLFLWLAFGSLEFIEGQIVGKIYMTVGAIIVIWGARYIRKHRLQGRNQP